jgi:cytochrome c biogenesis protein CcmG/thiol:disulfide interchange protein DsbE
MTKHTFYSLIFIFSALGLAAIGAIYDVYHPAPAVTVQSVPPATPPMGRPAPDFTLTDLSGATMTLSSLRGQVVIVNFWASWCAPCVIEWPLLIDLTAKFNGRVVLIAPSSDKTKGAVQTFIDQMHAQTKSPVEPPLVWVGVDPNRSITRDLYRVTTYPESFIIAPDGTVARHVVGIDDWNTGEVDQLIRGLLQD